MRILLANDDGIYAPGLHALRHALARLGEVIVVAPATEQSGVGHSITYLTPLTCKKVYDDNDELRGWAVDGSPADCVKLGVTQLAGGKVDLVVSGINHGLNAGINVLYSGTVAAAIEGAFFQIPSVAVSLEYDLHADFKSAAEMATRLIEQLLSRSKPSPELFNINIPTAATRIYHSGQQPEVHLVPLGFWRYGQSYIKRQDPKGRDYYWSANESPPQALPNETDICTLADGHITITPLQFDLTKASLLPSMQQAWSIQL
jgi:5'-nucleotidase